MELEDINRVEFDDKNIPNLSKEVQSIFHYNVDINKTSYLNWKMTYCSPNSSKFVCMGEAYLNTAYSLVQICLYNNSDKKADTWIFPILFNVIHGIEVYLKAINAILNVDLRKEQTQIQGNHNIKQLCCVSKKLIAELNATDGDDITKDMVMAIDVIYNFIDNIYQKTNDMTFARYPINKEKKNQFYIEDGRTVVDLEVLKSQLPIIYNLLKFIYEVPEMDIELRSEIEYELLNEMDNYYEY